MNQIKLNPDDPDVENINPAIISLARSNGYVRKPMELYLTGHLTWTQALETMVAALAKENRKLSTQILCNELNSVEPAHSAPALPEPKK